MFYSPFKNIDLIYLYHIYVFSVWIMSKNFFAIEILIPKWCLESQWNVPNKKIKI